MNLLPPSCGWTFFFCVAGGAVSLWWLASRASGDPLLRRILLASFWLRLGLGSVLYAASAAQWPVLRSLQVGGGFWSFALDAKLYHEWGVRVAEAWAAGIESPNPGTSYDYLAFLAFIYRLLGPHPLSAVLLNSWLGALSGWLAYRIGKQLFDARSAMRAALFVSAWPSSVLWSTQVLRDALTWLLVLLVLWLLASLVGPGHADGPADPPSPRGLARGWRWVLHAVAIGVATLLLTRLRIYLGSVLSLVAVMILVPAGCAALLTRRMGQAVLRVVRVMVPLVRRAAPLISIAVLMVGAVLVARDLNPNRLLSPAHPERGRVTLGLRQLQQGNVALAEAEFKRAIELRPDDPQAYLLWAGMLCAVHRPLEALAVCDSWLGAENGAVSQCVERLTAWSTQQAAATPTLPPPLPSPKRAVAPSPPRLLVSGVTAPSAPTHLKAKAFSGTQMSLSWAASADGVDVAGYRIFRGADLVGTSLGLSYQDIGLTPNIRYTYAVAAVDAAGNMSALTPAITAAIPPGTHAPPTPSRALLARWPLGDGAGSTATEASSQHPAGRLKNGPRWIHRSFGTALSFDGVDDYVDAGPIPPVTQSFTIAGWIYRAKDLQHNERAVWCSQGWNGESGWAALVHEHGGQMFHGFLKGGVAFVASGVPSAGTWEHVAWVVDAQAQPTLYLDGTQAAAIAHAAPILPPQPGISTLLGAGQISPAEPEAFFPGSLHDVRLYRSALTAEAIAELVRTASLRPSPHRAGALQASPEPALPDIQPPQVDARPQLQPTPASPVATLPPNEPPRVMIGPDLILRGQQTVVLRGMGYDDGQPTNALTYHWSQVSGPPARFMTTPAAVESQVHLPARGRYQFRLTVSDSLLDSSNDFVITVEDLSAAAAAAQLGDHVREIISEMNPKWLGSIRGSVIVSGGSSVIDAASDISRPAGLLRYLPRAIAVGFLAPFPWQWFDTGGSTGGMRVVAGAEAALVYLLLAGVALRAWRMIRVFGLIGCVRRTTRRMQLGGLFILVFGLVLGTAMGLVTANLGTLFRIRLLYWLPLLILVAAGDPVGNVAWAVGRLDRGLHRRMARGRGQPHRAAEPAAEPLASAPASAAGASGEPE